MPSRLIGSDRGTAKIIRKDLRRRQGVAVFETFHSVRGPALSAGSPHRRRPLARRAGPVRALPDVPHAVAPVPTNPSPWNFCECQGPWYVLPKLTIGQPYLPPGTSTLTSSPPFGPFWVVARDAAVLVEPQDLAGMRARVLRVAAGRRHLRGTTPAPDGH